MKNNHLITVTVVETETHNMYMYVCTFV